MPRMNGTGPQGDGPMTGRGRGSCRTGDDSGARGGGRGGGRGRGRGMDGNGRSRGAGGGQGRGRGPRGRGFGRAGRADDGLVGDSSVAAVLGELLSRVGAMEGVIGAVERRLEALRAPAADEEPKGDSD